MFFYKAVENQGPRAGVPVLVGILQSYTWVFNYSRIHRPAARAVRSVHWPLVPAARGPRRGRRGGALHVPDHAQLLGSLREQADRESQSRPWRAHRQEMDPSALCLGLAVLRERTDGTRSTGTCALHAKISCSAARRLAHTVHVVAVAAAAAAQKAQSRVSTNGEMTSASALSVTQKTELYHQGFTIVRGAVSHGLIQAARRLNLRGKGAGQSQEVLALLRDSSLNPILADLVGTPRLDISSEHGDWGCYPTIKPAPAQKSLELTAPSTISRDLHVDGLSAARLPDGSAVDWIDAAETVAVKPFRHFVFVSLNDQTQLGCGQTHVLSEGHLAMTEFFKWQLATCGKVGSCADG